jgi:hypothetical protein
MRPKFQCGCIRHSGGETFADSCGHATSYRHPSGICPSIQDTVMRSPPRDQTGIRRVIWAPLSGGVSVLVHFCFFRRTQLASIHSIDAAEDRLFTATFAPMYEPTGPSRSAACRPAVFHTQTALHALPSLLKSPAYCHRVADGAGEFDLRRICDGTLFHSFQSLRSQHRENLAGARGSASFVKRADSSAKPVRADRPQTHFSASITSRQSQQNSCAGQRGTAK